MDLNEPAPAEQAQGQAAQQGDGELLPLDDLAVTCGAASMVSCMTHPNGPRTAVKFNISDGSLERFATALAQRAGSAKPSPSEGPVVDMTEALLTEDEEDALYESIRMKLESHRMVRMFDIEEDGSLGNSHHLIDRLSLDASDISGADISTSKEEIESIIDTVFNGAKEYAMSIIAKRIHDRACTCWKCLAEFESAKPSEQAEAQSKAGVSVDTPTIWSMSPALGVMVPNSPRQANREQFYAVDEANAHTARAVAEALEGQLTEMGPRGALYLPQAWPDAWHALRDDVLSGVDGLDNDQINIVLGMLDNYEPVATIQPSQLAGAVQEPIDIIKEGNFSNRFEWVSDEVATNSLLIGMNVYAFATPAAVQSAPIDDATPVEAKPVERQAFEAMVKDRDSYKRMFEEACVDLGLINEKLGLDPDDGGADPIIDAIEELQAASQPDSERAGYIAAITWNAALDAAQHGLRGRVDSDEIFVATAIDAIEDLKKTGALSPLDSERDAALNDMETRKDAAYLERNQVVAALAKCFPSGVARTTIEGWSEGWHGCVYIDLPTGQVSWHFHDSHAYLFDGLPPYAGSWDGHDTPEKYHRLAAMAAAAPQKKEG